MRLGRAINWVSSKTFDNPAINLTNQLLVKREKSIQKEGICLHQEAHYKEPDCYHFAEKFELSKKTASSIIDEMAMLAPMNQEDWSPSHSPAW